MIFISHLSVSTKLMVKASLEIYSINMALSDATKHANHNDSGMTPKLLHNYITVLQLSSHTKLLTYVEPCKKYRWYHYEALAYLSKS